MINSPGEMTALIRIQYPKKVGTGSFAKTIWIDIGNTLDTQPAKWIYAKWENVHGSEAWTANSVQATAAATVSVWYNSSINPQCRVVDDAGLIYNIVSCDDVRKQHFQIELKVKAAVNGG